MSGFSVTNPFDIIKKNGTDLTAPNIAGGYSATYSVLVSTTYSNAFEMDTETPAADLLEAEQSTILYDE